MFTVHPQLSYQDSLHVRWENSWNNSAPLVTQMCVLKLHNFVQRSSKSQRPLHPSPLNKAEDPTRLAHVLLHSTAVHGLSRSRSPVTPHWAPSATVADVTD